MELCTCQNFELHNFVGELMPSGGWVGCSDAVGLSSLVLNTLTTSFLRVWE